MTSHVEAAENVNLILTIKYTQRQKSKVFCGEQLNLLWPMLYRMKTRVYHKSSYFRRQQMNLNGQNYHLLLLLLLLYRLLQPTCGFYPPHS